MHHSHKRNTKALTALLLGSALFFGITGAGSAEALTKPSWTSPSVVLSEANTEEQVSIKELHAVPSKNLVYVHTSQPVTKTSSNTTLDWQLDSLQAYDATSGQLKWSTIFHEKAGLTRSRPNPCTAAPARHTSTWHTPMEPRKCIRIIHPAKPIG